MRSFPATVLTPELTFIILARPDDLSASTHRLLSLQQVQACKMVGDVNLFIPEGQEDAECEIMIAGECKLPC